MARNKTSNVDETQLLVLSRRRCAICFGLYSDHRPKNGQIAHVDRDATNSALDNLAWLCLAHHDEYDTRRSQSKGFTPGELKKYRDELYLFIDAQRRRLEPAASFVALSPEGLSLAALLNEKSENGYKLDRQIRIAELSGLLELTPDDVDLAIDELKSNGLLELNGSRDIVFPTNRLFWETDAIFRDWDPATDSEAVARAILSRTEKQVPLNSLAESLAWSPRRLNPAATYLVESGKAEGWQTIGSAPFWYYRVLPTVATRRFVRDLDRSANVPDSAV